MRLHVVRAADWRSSLSFWWKSSWLCLFLSGSGVSSSVNLSEPRWTELLLGVHLVPLLPPTVLSSAAREVLEIRKGCNTIIFMYYSGLWWFPLDLCSREVWGFFLAASPLSRKQTECDLTRGRQENEYLTSRRMDVWGPLAQMYKGRSLRILQWCETIRGSSLRDEGGRAGHGTVLQYFLWCDAFSRWSIFTSKSTKRTIYFFSPSSFIA